MNYALSMHGVTDPDDGMPGLVHCADVAWKMFLDLRRGRPVSEYMIEHSDGKRTLPAP